MRFENPFLTGNPPEEHVAALALMAEKSRSFLASQGQDDILKKTSEFPTQIERDLSAHEATNDFIMKRYEKLKQLSQGFKQLAGNAVLPIGTGLAILFAPVWAGWLSIGIGTALIVGGLSGSIINKSRLQRFTKKVEAAFSSQAPSK